MCSSDLTEQDRRAPAVPTMDLPGRPPVLGEPVTTMPHLVRTEHRHLRVSVPVVPVVLAIPVLSRHLRVLVAVAAVLDI